MRHISEFLLTKKNPTAHTSVEIEKGTDKEKAIKYLKDMGFSERKDDDDKRPFVYWVNDRTIHVRSDDDKPRYAVYFDRNNEIYGGIYIDGIKNLFGDALSNNIIKIEI